MEISIGLNTAMVKNQTMKNAAVLFVLLQKAFYVITLILHVKQPFENYFAPFSL